MLYNQTDGEGSRQTTAALTETRLFGSRGMAECIVIQCAGCGQDISLKPSEAAVRKTCSRQCQWRYLMDLRRINPVSTQKPIEVRFWRNVDRTPGYGPNGDCWIWMGNANKQGYGRIMHNNKKNMLAHICSYLLHHGNEPVPDGLCVCHSCDMPSCVNPSHLWLGTASDNMKDKVAKGRANVPKGSAHYKAKLTESDVKAILNDSRDIYTLAAQYGVSRALIGNIRHGRAWMHIPRT